MTVVRPDYIKLPRGIRVAVNKVGNGKKGIFYIHGLGDGAYVWDPFVRHFPGWQSIVIDLPGHGNSSWNADGRYSLQLYLNDMLALFSSLNLCSGVLIGHSLGGAVVARILSNSLFPARACMLVDSGPIFDEEVVLNFRQQLLESYRIYRSVQEYTNWLRKKCPLASMEMLRSSAEHSLVINEDGRYRLKFDIKAADLLVQDQAEHTWWWRAITEINCPTLLVRGSGSAILRPAVARRMASLNSKCEMVTISASGHAIMADNPNAFGDVVTHFLEKYCTE